MKAKITIAAFLLHSVCLVSLAQIPLVYHQENTGAQFPLIRRYCCC